MNCNTILCDNDPFINKIDNRRKIFHSKEPEQLMQTAPSSQEIPAKPQYNYINHLGVI